MIQTLRMISECIICNLDSTASQRIKEQCANFLICVCSRMLFVYRVALVLLMFYFNVESFLKHKKNFVRVPLQKRSEIVSEWQKSGVPFKRQFIKYIQSLTLLSYYDSKEVTDSLNIDRTKYLQILSFYAGV